MEETRVGNAAEEAAFTIDETGKESGNETGSGTRITVFTGKGGVGKTSAIAAHAVLCARKGEKTILVSADMAHNLGDIFEIRTGGVVVEAQKDLFLLEPDPVKIMQEEFPQVNKAILEMLSGKKTVPEEAGRFMVPGFENLFTLFKIKKLYESGEYRRIFVDCAPSGETLSLLKLPELLSWYIEKFFPVGKLITRVLRPVSGGLFKVQLPDSGSMDEFLRLHGELVELQDLLKDPSITDVRLVALPEKMVVEETKRTYMYLNLYGYHVDRLFINRVLGEQSENAFTRYWREIQQGYMEELERVFWQIPVTKIRWYETEIRGIDSLERLRQDLPPYEELFAPVPATSGENYEPEGEGWRLHLFLPGTADAKVSRYGLDLDVAAGNCLRRIPLPQTLSAMEVREVIRKEDGLEVLFLPKGAETGETEGGGRE